MFEITHIIENLENSVIRLKRIEKYLHYDKRYSNVEISDDLWPKEAKAFNPDTGEEETFKIEYGILNRIFINGIDIDYEEEET